MPVCVASPCHSQGSQGTQHHLPYPRRGDPNRGPGCLLWLDASRPCWGPCHKHALWAEGSDLLFPGADPKTYLPLPLIMSLEGRTVVIQGGSACRPAFSALQCPSPLPLGTQSRERGPGQRRLAPFTVCGLEAMARAAARWL